MSTTKEKKGVRPTSAGNFLRSTFNRPGGTVVAEHAASTAPDPMGAMQAAQPNRSMSVEVTETFEAAHRIPKFDGNCAQLHGHHWVLKVRVVVGDMDPDTGITIDYGVLKQVVRDAVTEPWDHKTFLHEDDPICGALQPLIPESLVVTTLPPSAEVLATIALEALKPAIPNATFQIELSEVEGSSVTITSD